MFYTIYIYENSDTYGATIDAHMKTVVKYISNANLLINKLSKLR